MVKHDSIYFNQDYQASLAFTGAITAHEMGHNFGLEHDDSKRS